MLQRSRSHLTVLLSSLALLACIASAQILAAHPAASRYRHLRQQRVGSVRPTEPHIDGDAHSESAIHHQGGLLSHPATSLTVESQTNIRCFDETPLPACALLRFPQFDAVSLPLPAACTRTRSAEQRPATGRSPPAA